MSTAVLSALPNPRVCIFFSRSDRTMVVECDISTAKIYVIIRNSTGEYIDEAGNLDHLLKTKAYPKFESRLRSDITRDGKAVYAWKLSDGNHLVRAVNVNRTDVTLNGDMVHVRDGRVMGMHTRRQHLTYADDAVRDTLLREPLDTYRITGVGQKRRERPDEPWQDNGSERNVRPNLTQTPMPLIQLPPPVNNVTVVPPPNHATARTAGPLPRPNFDWSRMNLSPAFHNVYNDGMSVWNRTAQQQQANPNALSSPPPHGPEHDSQTQNKGRESSVICDIAEPLIYILGLIAIYYFVFMHVGVVPVPVNATNTAHVPVNATNTTHVPVNETNHFEEEPTIDATNPPDIEELFYWIINSHIQTPNDTMRAINYVMGILNYTKAQRKQEFTILTSQMPPPPSPGSPPRRPGAWQQRAEQNPQETEQAPPDQHPEPQADL